MKKHLVLSIIVASLLNITTPVLAINANEDIMYDKIRFNSIAHNKSVDSSDMKSEIKTLNGWLNHYKKYPARTSNGVTITNPEIIINIDNIYTKITMRQELLRHYYNSNLDNYNYVQYPLISDYLTDNDYKDDFNTNNILTEKKDEDINKYNSEDFFKTQLISNLSKFIEHIDFMDINNVNVVFNPYLDMNKGVVHKRIATGEMNRASVIYLAPSNTTDYISLFLNGLGQQVFLERVVHDDNLVNTYRSFYENTLSDSELNECFAEDFKVFVSKKMILLDKYPNYIHHFGSDFLVNKTGNTSTFDMNSFFEEVIDYVPKEYKLRPDIWINLKEYGEFNKFVNDGSVLSPGYINKFVTHDKNAEITFFGHGEYMIKEIKVNHLNKYGEIINSKRYGERNYELSNSINIELDKFTQVIINLKNNDGIEDSLNYYFYR